MKKSFLATVITVATIYSLQAQDFYVRAGAGYGFATAGQTIGASGAYSGSLNSVITANTIEEDFSLKRISLLSGIQAKLGIGYMFNQNVGVEVDALIGAVTSKFAFDLVENDNGTVYKESNTLQANTPIILSPSVVMQIPGKTVTCYARGGVAIPAANKLTRAAEVEENFDPTYPITRELEWEIKTSLGVGFSGAMGVRYNIGKHLQFWGEASLLSLSLYTREQTLTKYLVNGSNVISFVDPNQRHQLFELENSTGNANASNVLPSYSVPYSNIGICVGVSTRL